MVIKVSSLLSSVGCHTEYSISSGLQSWRRLGDVIASAFALGYHENLQTRLDVPAFLVDLRKSAFARLYSGDKNVAIFLGRPPRMSKKFCHFQIPSSIPDTSKVSPGRLLDPEDWDSNARISYRADTRWSALCASLKEDILEVLMHRDRSNMPPRTRSDSYPVSRD